MTCKRSKQCDHADICRFAQSDDYNLLGGSCFTPKDPQTNEEWLKSCTTEQLAEFLNLIIRVGPYENEPKDFWEHVYGRGGDRGAKSIVEWLKQPHQGE